MLLAAGAAPRGRLRGSYTLGYEPPCSYDEKSRNEARYEPDFFAVRAALRAAHALMRAHERTPTLVAQRQRARPTNLCNTIMYACSARGAGGSIHTLLFVRRATIAADPAHYL